MGVWDYIFQRAPSVDNEYDLDAPYKNRLDMYRENAAKHVRNLQFQKEAQNKLELASKIHNQAQSIAKNNSEQLRSLIQMQQERINQLVQSQKILQEQLMQKEAMLSSHDVRGATADEVRSMLANLRKNVLAARIPHAPPPPPAVRTLPAVTATVTVSNPVKKQKPGPLPAAMIENVMAKALLRRQLLDQERLQFLSAVQTGNSETMRRLKSKYKNKNVFMSSLGLSVENLPKNFVY